MPWKVGGNFETVAVTCKINWKECVIAVAKYFWCEIVSDVVDYLAKEGIIWVLAIAIASTILIRIKYRKNMHTKNIIRNKKILNKVGYKIQDLELKVNILTYKMQYGTWPLPHQIYSLNPKKLQKIRMTLSNPGDRKNWIKHVLLSPVESNIRAPHQPHQSSSNMFSPSTAKLNHIFEIKRKHTPHYFQYSKLLTDCSSIETSKSTSDQSINTCSRRPGTHSQNMSVKGSELSKSENFTLQRQNVQLLPLAPGEITRRSSRIPLTQNSKCVTCSTNAKCFDSPYQKFTDTVYKRKSFLKEFEYNNEHLHSLSYSSETSETSSLKAAHRLKQPTLFTMKKGEISCDARKEATTAKKEINEMEHVTKIKSGKTIKDVEEIYRQNDANISNAFPKELVIPIIPITQTGHNVQSSGETLHEVRKKLQSLDNVLRIYQDVSQSSEKQELVDQVDKTDAFLSVGPKIKEADKNKTEINRNDDSKKNLQQKQCSIVDSCEYFEIDCSEGSSSSLTECSLKSFKTHENSNDITSQNTYSNVLPVLKTTGPNDYKHHSRFCSATLQKPRNCENEYKGSVYEHISNHSHSHELELHPEINEDVTKTNALFNHREKEGCGAVSEKICYILSPESFEDKNMQTQNETFSIRKFVTGKYSNTLGEEQYQENMIISQNSSQSKMSNNSDREDKSTTLLLQEALHFKKALLTQVQSRKTCSLSSKEDDITDESLEYETHVKNSLPSMILDIKTEEPITSSLHDKTNQRYVYLEIKQRRDVFPKSLQQVNTLTHHENETNTENQNSIFKTPSEYFSITNLAIYKNNKIKSNVPLSLEPPLYEKVISITIPINTKNQEEINTNEKSMQTKTVLRNTQTHVNLQEDLGKKENIGNKVDDEHLPAMLKLEDLILERVKDIRDYMDNFLQSQNRAISNVCKALQLQGKNNTFRCSNGPCHVVLHNQLTDQVAGFSKNSPDFLTNTWPNYKHKVFIEDDILKCYSDIRLKKNSEMFTSFKNEFSKENDAQWSKTAELERKETDLSLPVTLNCSCESDSNSREITDLNMLCCEEYVMSNTETYNSGASPLSSSVSMEEKTLNIENKSLNNLKENDETSTSVAHLSPSPEHHSTKRLLQTYSRIKAKSDISLITSRSKDLNISLCPEKSHSFFMGHNTLEHIRKILRQPYGKLHNNKSKCIENKLRPTIATRSKSIMSPQRVSTKSYIPILKDHLETTRQTRHQTHTKSPTRSPLTMLQRKKTYEKDHIADEEINKHLYVEKAELNVTKLNTEKDIIVKKLEKPNTACRDINISKRNLEILSTDQNVESLTDDKDQSNKRCIYDNKSDTKRMEHIENIASKGVTVISITNDHLQKNYTANSFIMETGNVCSATDLLIHKNKLWTIIVEKTEKEVTAKPSVADTCTSVSDLH